jgi:hypothetical protein
MSFYAQTPAVDYYQKTMRRISLALGYDGQANQQCWDWINAVSERWGNDGLDERLDFCLKYYDNTGYLACSAKFKKTLEK